MIGKRDRTEPKTEETKPMRDGRTTEPTLQTGDEIDASFRKIRGDLRITLWLASATLVMTAILFTSVFFLGVRM